MWEKGVGKGEVELNGTHEDYFGKKQRALKRDSNSGVLVGSMQSTIRFPTKNLSLDSERALVGEQKEEKWAIMKQDSLKLSGEGVVHKMKTIG